MDGTVAKTAPEDAVFMPINCHQACEKCGLLCQR